MAIAGDGEPVVLPDGTVLVPGSVTSLLAEFLRHAARQEGRLHPWLVPLAQALGEGAARFRLRDTHLLP